MGTDFEVTMDEYLPLRDVVYAAAGNLKRGTEAGRKTDGDPACEQTRSEPDTDP